ncbi:MAG: TolC family protein [Acidobacteriaceae bacterium]
MAMMRTPFIVALLSLPMSAQDSLSLKDAVHLALRQNKSIQASSAASKAAESRLTGARGGNFPKINYSESWIRSDNPVFVFSSLLTQRQFGEQNFQIHALNEPGFLNNFQSQITADQPLFDAGQTKHAIRSAELTRDITSEDGRRTQMEVIAVAIRSYYDTLLATEQSVATNQALRSSEADLVRAQNVRSAGMSTDVDVLSIRVQLSGVREQEIRHSADLDVARATLNDVLGLPLDTPHTLTTPLAPLTLPGEALTQYEANALAERPEARQAKLAASLAENQVALARGSLLPQVGARAVFEADRQRFYSQGGSNWLVSIGLRWNLFNGFSDKAHVEETKFAFQRSLAEQDRTVSTIRLQVRRMYADLQAAQQRIEVTNASIREAEESLRITQNRYEAGFGSVTDLLRTETAVLEAHSRHLAAIHDQRIAAAMLEFAAGTLTADSEVLKVGSR